MSDVTQPSATDAASHDEAYCSACNQSYPVEMTTCPKDGARLVKLSARRDDLIGRVLDGRYEIRAPLGKGGMGTVYRGWQLSVDREVAIKVIHPKLAGDMSAVKRFLREARLASRLSQPTIVSVYDFGQADDLLYIAMELLRGHTLAAELAKGRLDVRRAIAIGIQLCDALAAAHAQGIVHRDLKPSNIVILDDPPGRDLIKVLDFGLAKSLVQDSGSAVTNSNAVLGTPLYMSPEQIEGGESDQRADLYSLGCILFELITGRPPFVDSAVSAVLARHISEAPAPLPPRAPDPLRTLVARLLAKAPADRPASAREVHDALAAIRDAPELRTPASAAEVADTLPGSSPAPSPALAETQLATPAVAASVPAITPRRSRRWGALAATIGASLVALGVVALRRERETPGTRAVEHSPVRQDAPLATAPPTDAPVTDAPVDAAVPVDAAAPDAALRSTGHHSVPPHPRALLDAGDDLPPVEFHH